MLPARVRLRSVNLAIPSTATQVVVPPSVPAFAARVTSTAARAGGRRLRAPQRVQTASSSLTSFGTAAVRFSRPSSVTSTSSSIRIPTPRISWGAPSSSAAT